MKELFIGDVHGHKTWLEIIKKEKPDRVIFVGDYFDSETLSLSVQINNFKSIIEYKKSNPNTILLIGNHDYHYFSYINNINTSGFQGGIAKLKICMLLESIEMKMAYQIDNLLISHAGISEVWLKDNNWEGEDIVEYVNDLWYYRPTCFGFKLSNNERLSNGSGNNVYQSPIWIRQRALQLANYDSFRKEYIQIFGHTHMDKIDFKGVSTDGRYFNIDTLPNEYLMYQDKQFKLGKC